MDYYHGKFVGLKEDEQFRLGLSKLGFTGSKRSLRQHSMNKSKNE